LVTASSIGSRQPAGLRPRALPGRPGYRGCSWSKRLELPVVAVTGESGELLRVTLAEVHIEEISTVY